MSNLTKPSRAAYGEIRFPRHDAYHSEVITYTMSKEEMRKRYGVPLNERISKKRLYQLRRKGLSNQEIARMYGVTAEQIKALFNYYRARK